MRLSSKRLLQVLWLGIFITNECMQSKIDKNSSPKKENEEQIPLTEDLMREHGILNRILLIYEELIKRFENGEMQLKALDQAATIIKDFIENYHEKLEEDFLFPVFEKKKVQVKLIKTLRLQHSKGRDITAKLKTIAHDQTTVDKKTCRLVISLLKKFIKMYRPHEAREDTVLFPQVRSLMSETEFKALGEKFEDLEHELFGEEGFFTTVKKVESIEKSLNIYDLEKFTPMLKN